MSQRIEEGNDFSAIEIKILTENGINPQISEIREADAERVSALMQRMITDNISILYKIGCNVEDEEGSALFFKKYNEIWGECIHTAKCYINLLANLCGKIKIIADEEHIKEYVLARLMGRGIRTYAEVIILLQNGFPYGAASLSRNLFELMTIARFIVKNDASVALEYYRETDKTPEQQNKEDYEWARKSGEFEPKEKITLRKIREKAGMVDLEYCKIYAFLCKFTHASPQTVNYDMFATSDDIFHGPSLFGVEVPGINATLFLRDLMISFCGISNNPELNTMELVCAEFATYLCYAFNVAAEECIRTTKNQTN